MRLQYEPRRRLRLREKRAVGTDSIRSCGFAIRHLEREREHLTRVSENLSAATKRGERVEIRANTKSLDIANAANQYLADPSSQSAIRFLLASRKCEGAVDARADLFNRMISVLRKQAVNPALSLADSATITTTDTDRVQRVAAANAFPVFAGTVAPYEVIARFARAHNRDSSVTRILPAFSSYRTGEAPLVFFAGDSAWLGNPAAPRYARIDRSGRIEGISARATTTRGETRRTADYDLASIISHFPDIPPDKNIVGAPGISPRDTARGQLGRATISVDYGRPAVRGRDVFARGVLGDTLWRVGANAATQFTTDRDLKFGESTLRAGTYSMWMRVTPDDSRFELVFNSQIGQWGTEHHADRDVLTVPLRRLKGSAPVERLTITLPQSGEKSGAMRIVWGTTVLATPVSVP